MSRQEIFEGIQDVLVQKYEIDANSIHQKASLLGEIGIASLEFMNFMLDIENRFGFVFNFEVYIITIEDLIDYIISKKG